MFRHLWDSITRSPSPPNARPAFPAGSASGAGAGGAERRACRPTESLFSVDVLGRTMVATVAGSELTGLNAAEVAAGILQHLESEPGLLHLVLDLQNVQHVDSGGVSRLIFLLREVQRRGGRVAVAGASGRVGSLFKLTCLDRVFTVRRTTLDAIGAVERAAA